MNVFSSIKSSAIYLRSLQKQASANWLVSVVNKFVPIIVLLSVILLLLRAKDLPPVVPLWYAKPWGEEQLTSPWWLTVLPATSLITYIINVVASAYLTVQHLVFTQLLYATALMVSLLSFVTLIKILLLVT